MKPDPMYDLDEMKALTDEDKQQILDFPRGVVGPVRVALHARRRQPVRLTTAASASIRV